MNSQLKGYTWEDLNIYQTGGFLVSLRRWDGSKVSSATSSDETQKKPRLH